MTYKPRVATDVGGTFTDLVFISEDSASGSQRIQMAKVDTTPPAFERGVLNVVEQVGIDCSELGSVIHGSTVVINALTERKGVKTALITTQGFRDVLEIARGDRPDMFNLRYSKPEPFVPRYLRYELAGRISYSGEEIEPLELSALPEIVEDMRANNVAALAICFLHSYANPKHERELLEAVNRQWPELEVVASHQTCRQWREYERTNTAVMSAYVKPIVRGYVGRLKEGLEQSGFRESLYLMGSSGGVSTIQAVVENPVSIVESGPASGFLAAAELGKVIDEPNILALDIGGTTAKCSLIINNRLSINSDYHIERSRQSPGYPLLVPTVDLTEIGNGGGSIAVVDDFGRLRVGPESAGANPGPIAYGQGGDEPTTTDANLLLGRINPEYFCGGSKSADMSAVQVAFEALGNKLQMTPEQAAQAVLRIANNNMINALKLMSVNRGHDPRELALVAFGGGGALHAAALGKELGVRKIVVPFGAEVFSAWGMLMTNLRQELFVNRLFDVDESAWPKICDLFHEVCKDLANDLSTDTPIEFSTNCMFRYRNQDHAMGVPVSQQEFESAEFEKIVERFHRQYEKEFTYRMDATVEFVGMHVAAEQMVGRLELEESAENAASSAAAIKGRRTVNFAVDGIHDSTIFDGEALAPGAEFRGPAIIEHAGTTIVVHPGQKVRIDPYRNTHISFESS